MTVRPAPLSWGTGAHTLDEHIEVSSLVERAQLMAEPLDQDRMTNAPRLTWLIIFCGS